MVRGVIMISVLFAWGLLTITSSERTVSAATIAPADKLPVASTGSVSGVTPTPSGDKLSQVGNPSKAISYTTGNKAPRFGVPSGEAVPPGHQMLMEELNKKKIGILEGSIFDVWAQQALPNAKIDHYNTLPDSLSALKSGKVDALLHDTLTAVKAAEEDPSFRVMEPPLFYRDVAVGVKLGNNALADRINQFIAKANKEGILADMEKRWIYSEVLPSSLPSDLIPLESSKVFKVALCSTMYPYVYRGADSAIVGYDMEFAIRLANDMGMKLEVQDMNFAAMIPAVASGKADAAITILTITPERAKNVLFTDPYILLPASAVMRSTGTGGAVGGSGEIGTSFLGKIKNSFYSNLILENRYLLILDGLKVTVIIAILTGIFGTLLGSLICFLRMSGRKTLHFIAGIYISILRGMPVLVLLMLIFYVVFASVDLNPVLVAVLAFGMNFAAYVSEIFRTGIEGVERGQTEAGVAMGFSRVQTFFHIIAPQAIRRILPVYKGEFISMVKMTSVVGYIAVQDLTKASDIIRSRTFDAFFPLVIIAILYFALSGILITILGSLEARSDPRRKRLKA